MTPDEIRSLVREEMDKRTLEPSDVEDDDFDFSTTVAEDAIRATASLLLEIRQDVDSRLARKVHLYERTLGLAVIPVLLRRAILKARAQSPLRRRSGR